MIICGLDISTSFAGWALFEDGELIGSGNYRFKKEKDYDLIYLANQFDEHIFPKIKHADEIAIEEALRGFGRSTNSIAILIGWNAIVQYKLRKNGYNVVPYHPSTAKKLAWGRGRAPKGSDSKTWILSEVTDKYGIEWPQTRYGNPKPGSDDEADAITIGLAHINNQNKT